jgi:hypothetical protein
VLSGSNVAWELAEENADLRRRLRSLEAQGFNSRRALDVSRSQTPEEQFAAEASGFDGGPRSDRNADVGAFNDDAMIPFRYLYACPAVTPVGAPPARLPVIDVNADLASIRDAFGHLLADGASAAIEVRVATVSSLGQAAMAKGSWVHLSAHGIAGQALALEDENDPLGARAHSLGLDGLRELLRAGGGVQCALVFLAVCQSAAFARVFRDAGASHVIFCPTMVGDKRARRFARDLYGALARGHSLGHAYAFARSVAELSKDNAEYGILSDGELRLFHPCLTTIPQLNQYSETPHRERKFGAAAATKRQVEDFVGRVDVIYRVLAFLGRLSRRVVLLHSEASLGRSATLKEIAHHVTTPGRIFSHSQGCAFYPGKAPGGLLIVDDADTLTSSDQDTLRRHLEREGAQLLLSCRQLTCGDPFSGEDKPMCVALDPLQPVEAAELFLRRCQRALRAEDLLPPKLLQGRNAKETIPEKTALELLTKPIQVFAGMPGRVRKAVDEWSKRGSPPIHGDMEKLALAAKLPLMKTPNRRCPPIDAGSWRR